MKGKQSLYRFYSQYLVEKYGEKTYKLPVNLPITCPNRDGKLGTGGCTFCAEGGTVFENLPGSGSSSVKQQIENIKKHIKEKYKANKYIVYFQNFSNTYMPIDDFKNYIKDALVEDIVEIAISTRPDCVQEGYLEFLSTLRQNRRGNIIRTRTSNC